MEDEPMYTIRAAGNLLSVSDDTIRRTIKSGALPASKIGGQYRIKASDLDAYIDANKINTNGGGE